MPTPNTLQSDASPLFTPYETVIENWEALVGVINRFGDAHRNETFVWRGQADATWPLTSSLYRVVATQLGRLPTERDIVAAEARLLRMARHEWRLDGIPALQLFARMQHVGVPTRLIDATLNPLIAAWFAVTGSDGVTELDGRLFAFTVKARIQLNSRWNANTPRWHPNGGYPNPTEWGTGLGRRVWQPPALHTRIPAQNAVFLLDGVPVDGRPDALARIHPDESDTWPADELRKYASIPVRFGRLAQFTRTPSKGLVYTYRITAPAKRAIRHQLEDRFGYRFATIYADIEGLAEYLRLHPGRFVHS